MEKIYSLHRYIDESGAPDYEKIFTEGEGLVKKHLDGGLVNILQNQPEVVREVVDKHLKNCDECRQKFDSPAGNSGQLELPDMLNKD